jgi:adenylate kinase family enzyme
MIIGILGKKGSGKDTMAEFLIQQYQFKQFTYAEPLKKICQDLFSLTDEQVTCPILKETVDQRWGKSPRQILQEIGTDLFRKHYDENIWVKILKEKIILEPKEQNIVVSDIRHQNELDTITEFTNCLIFRIERPNVSTLDNHSTENNILQYNNIITIQNNSTIQDFHSKIKTILEQVIN